MLNSLYGGLQIQPQDLLKVKGIESARMYPTQPNSRVALFDEDDDVFYIIRTDSSNFKSEVRRYRYIEEPIESSNNNYVTKDEFNSLKEEIGNVQQSIQQLANNLSRKPKRYNGNGARNGTVEATIVDG